MHFDFRPLLRRTFAELSRNFRENIPIHRPWPSASEHQGPWCLALAKPHFWKLGCCIWSLFLETSKIIIRRWQRQVQGCASGPWCLAVAKPHLWKLGCYLWRAKWLSKSITTQGTEPEILGCPSPAGPQAAVGGSPLHNDYNIRLPQNFHGKKMLLARTRKKTFAKVPNITLTFFAIKTLYKDLWIDHQSIKNIFKIH